MHSDYTITDFDLLYRRIPRNNPNCWKEINGVKIPSSANFKTNKDEDGLSVNIASLITPEESVAKYPKDVIAEFSASIPRSDGYICTHKPSNSNHSHAIIEGNTNPIAKKLSKSITKVHLL